MGFHLYKKKNMDTTFCDIIVGKNKASDMRTLIDVYVLQKKSLQVFLMLREWGEQTN